MPTMPKPDVRFVYKTQSRDTYETFKASVVYLDDENKVRNPCSWDHGPLAPLSDLVITAQRSTDPNDTDDWYAIELCYEPHQVKLADAERMVKLLRTLTKKLARLEERYGRAEDLAAFCGRVADVLDTPNVHVWGTHFDAMRADGSNYYWRDVNALRSNLARPRKD